MAWLHNRARRVHSAGGGALLANMLLLLILATGCSGVIEPITPYQPAQISNPTASSLEFQSGRSLWGFYKMTLNDDHSEIAVEPLRSTQLHLNVVGTIESISPTSIAIGNIVINPDGSITVEVSLTHPLIGYDKYTGFDVRGIMMLPSVYSFPAHALTTPGIFVGESALLNADGYTRRWNPTEFSDGVMPFAYKDGKWIPKGMGALCTSLVNPFKAYYSFTNRRYIKPGDIVIRHYVISFPPGPQVFAYAIDASWEPNIVTVAYQTSFEESDPDSGNWDAKELANGTPTDFWKCGWFTGSVNVRDEVCSAYMGEQIGAVLFSREFSIPDDTSDVDLKIKHTLEFPTDNLYDGAAVFVTPDFALNPIIELSCGTHAYDTLDDPYAHFDWWTKDYILPDWDIFDMSPALTQLKALGETKFRVIFVFANAYDDIEITKPGWTINEMEIWDYNAPPTEIPGSFPPGANSLEPYEMKLTEVQGSMDCSLGKYAGGSVNVKIQVSDWQGGANVAFDKVRLEAPDLFDGTVSPWTGSGSISTYTYEIAVPNDKKATPGEVPVLLSLISGDEDENYLPEDPLAAYMMFTLEVNEISPPFCLDETAIHTDYAGTFQIQGSSVNQHLTCSFMPIISGGAGGLLYDGGISGDTEHIQVAAIPGQGGTTTGNNLIEFTGGQAGNAFVLEANEFNGHILVVTTDDRDNMLIYNAAGNLLKSSFDLGNGQDGIDEPVVVATNPANGDIWIIGDRGTDGIFLERWAFVKDGDVFDYIKDPASQIDLSGILGGAPKPFGIAFNTYYNVMYLFHGRFFGSLEVYELGHTPPLHNDELSAINLFTKSLTPTLAPGLRKQLGGGIAIDHVDGDGDSAGACRILMFANTDDGGSQLVKYDTWGHKLGSSTLGSPFSCMDINNLPNTADRSLAFFPLSQGMAYSLFLAPVGW